MKWYGSVIFDWKWHDRHVMLFSWSASERHYHMVFNGSMPKINLKIIHCMPMNHIKSCCTCFSDKKAIMPINRCNFNFVKNLTDLKFNSFCKCVWKWILLCFFSSHFPNLTQQLLLFLFNLSSCIRLFYVKFSFHYCVVFTSCGNFVERIKNQFRDDREICLPLLRTNLHIM